MCTFTFGKLSKFDTNNFAVLSARCLLVTEYFCVITTFTEVSEYFFHQAVKT